MHTRIFHLLCLSAAFACLRPVAGQELSARQVIIRAPEVRIVAAALANAEDDALAKLLWEWVRDGTAEVVSDLKSDLSSTSPAHAKSGRDFDWVVENDQEFGNNSDVAILTPSHFQKVFIGSSMGAKMLNSHRNAQRRFVESSWNAFFSPCEERSVPWSYWWDETTKQPKVSWYQQKDFFVEEILTSARFTPGSSTVLGIVRRADHQEPFPKRIDTLDVILAQVGPTSSQAAPAKEVRHSPHGRCTIIGFGVNDLEAVTMLAGSTTPHGKPLLDTLLKKLAAGEVKMRLFTSMALFQSQRSSLKSVRQHSYPTEMPTIPSAWDTRDTGTLVEIKAVHCDLNFEFEFHPAAPRRAEWRCALETPDLFMWQPQFFVRKVKTGIVFGEDGVALLGAMRTPESQEGARGIVAGETLVFMARLDGMTVIPEDQAGPATRDLALDPHMELEAIVFDIPAAEGAAWRGGLNGPFDEQRFDELMARTKGKDVKLAAHVALSAKSGQRAEVSTIEEVKTVTQVDPPSDIAPTRYRPTAIEAIDCGTAWRVEAQLYRPEDPLVAMGPLEIYLSHTLRHHVAPPREPRYEDMIAEARVNRLGRVPEATIFEESWNTSAILVPGRPRFIGLREPPGDAFKDRLHVAFVRARVTEGRKAASNAAPADPFAPAAGPK